MDHRNTVEWLLKQPGECEWLEFKLNFHSPEEIGERISALANGACISKQPNGYLVFGIENETHAIIGTSFNPATHKKGNEPLENWLVQRLSPKIEFQFYNVEIEDKRFVLFEIPQACGQPVTFLHISYIRIGSVTRKLSDFPEKERKIWMSSPDLLFAKEIALRSVSAAQVIEYLDTQAYFDLLVKTRYPTTQEAVIERLLSENIIVQNRGAYDITNLGGLLFAKDVKKFPTLVRKAARVVVYEGQDKLKTKRDIVGTRGYAVGFQLLIQFITSQLPANEEISKIIRETTTMYPEDAIRELVANSLIHQDFSERGTGPLVEIFSDRIEITNPGLPLILPLRFIDEFQSRNEEIAALMRRIGICEEKGSGIDRVISQCEVFQLPAPDFQENTRHTKVILYAYKKLNDMDKPDRIRACYQHCCLRYISNNIMTNQSLRERFQIEDQNAATASRIISDTVDAGLIKLEDPNNKSRRYPKYIPIWA
ncbi:ATP-binding protein [Pinibacter soli]|uniref:ATP-binding protein n=1 Tax=Pinibacter soli TaxID=3044211 RepID=A0ABT6RHB2_9BACT|nr:RNA-binding domain-containing protein [Pinibacter soli]MDI3321968.1 ATP-binding protein [Pinibacter soli]